MTIINRVAALYAEALGERMGLDVEVREKYLVFTVGADVKVLIHLFANDPEYLRMTATFADFGRDLGTETVDRICAHSTLEKKGVKAVFKPASHELVCAVEMVVSGQGQLPSVDHLAAVLPRAVVMLQTGITDVLTSVQLARISSATDGD